MTTHWYTDCPALTLGDDIADSEALDIPEYDCQTCQYVERHRDKSWRGGYLNGLQQTLYRLDDVQVAIGSGHTKLQVFRLLCRDWSHSEEWHTSTDPHFLPLLIMTFEEMQRYQCPTCDAGTGYSHTEGDTDIFVCEHCGHQVGVLVMDRPG